LWQVYDILISAIGADCNLQHLKFANKVEDMFAEITAFKENIPVGYQPDNDISVGPGQYHSVLLLHAEFYALQVTMYTALGAAVDGASGWLAIEAHSSLRIRKQTTFRVSSARRLLQILNTITDSRYPGPNVIYWYVYIWGTILTLIVAVLIASHDRVQKNQVFAAFNFIYTHLMLWPSLSSSISDLQLLCRTCQHVAMEMRDSVHDRDISTLLVTMYNAALQVVGQTQASLIAGSSDRRILDLQHSLVPLSADDFLQNSGNSTPGTGHSDRHTERSAWPNEQSVMQTIDRGIWRPRD
jgi:hypothetical protein